MNDYRRFTGEAVRLAMTKFIKLAGNKVKMLGFSWQVLLRENGIGRSNRLFIGWLIDWLICGLLVNGLLIGVLMG